MRRLLLFCLLWALGAGVAMSTPLDITMRQSCTFTPPLWTNKGYSGTPWLLDGGITGYYRTGTHPTGGYAAQVNFLWTYPTYSWSTDTPPVQLTTWHRVTGTFNIYAPTGFTFPTTGTADIDAPVAPVLSVFDHLYYKYTYPRQLATAGLLNKAAGKDGRLVWSYNNTAAPFSFYAMTPSPKGEHIYRVGDDGTVYDFVHNTLTQTTLTTLPGFFGWNYGSGLYRIPGHTVLIGYRSTATDPLTFSAIDATGAARTITFKHSDGSPLSFDGMPVCFGVDAWNQLCIITQRAGGSTPPYALYLFDSFGPDDTETSDDPGPSGANPYPGRGLESVDTALDEPSGREYAVWEDGLSIFSSVRMIGQTAWGDPVRVSAAGELAIKPGIAIAPDGTARCVYELGGSATQVAKHSSTFGASWS